MVEKTQVVFHEHADIWDTGQIHGQTLEAEAKREAANFLGIENTVPSAFTDSFKDGGVDHAATSQLHPFVAERLAAYKESGVTSLDITIPVGVDPVATVEKLRSLM